MSARLPWGTLAAYAAPGLPLALLISPFPALLTSFYATHTAASTAGIATALLFARILNGLVDPPIGFLSDRTRSPLGPRKPWMLAGAGVAVLAFLIAYMPPEGAGDLYFAGAIIAFYVAHSLIDTPYRTWSGEVSGDYGERARLAGATTLALLVGGVGFLALPEILAAAGVLDSAELDREAMAILGWVGVVAMPVAIAISAAFVPRGEVTRGEKYTLAEMRTVFTGNAPFRRFIAADVVSQIGWAVSYALLAIVIGDYWGFGDKVLMFLLIATLAQILAVPVCAWLARQLGKHVVYGWCQILNGLMMPVYLLFPPGGAADLTLLLALGAFVSALGTPNMMYPQALLSDIADYDALKTRQSRAGAYFSFRTLLAPAGGAIGGALGFYMLAIVGYDPGGEANTPAATYGMLATAVALPAVAFVISGLLMLGYPITASRHAAIRARLARRAGLPGTVGGDAAALSG